ncbi:hypothetical protein D3C80_1139610 [compost metagenome]
MKTANDVIKVTEEHPFYVKGKGWTKVKDLKRHDVFGTKDNQYQELISIKKFEAETEVYNIEIDGNHNYFISQSGILVHNKKIVE